jgi:hypothetical protein
MLVKYHGEKETEKIRPFNNWNVLNVTLLFMWIIVLPCTQKDLHQVIRISPKNHLANQWGFGTIFNKSTQHQLMKPNATQSPTHHIQILVKSHNEIYIPTKLVQFQEMHGHNLLSDRINLHFLLLPSCDDLLIKEVFLNNKCFCQHVNSFFKLNLRYIWTVSRPYYKCDNNKNNNIKITTLGYLLVTIIIIITIYCLLIIITYNS